MAILEIIGAGVVAFLISLGLYHWVTSSQQKDKN